MHQNRIKTSLSPPAWANTQATILTDAQKGLYWKYWTAPLDKNKLWTKKIFESKRILDQNHLYKKNVGSQNFKQISFTSKNYWVFATIR